MSNVIENKLNSVVEEVSKMNKQGYLFAFSQAKDFDALFNTFKNVKNLPVSKKLFEETLGKLYAKWKWSKSPICKLVAQLSSLFTSRKGGYYFISVLNHIDIKGDSNVGRMRLVKLDDDKIKDLREKYNYSEFDGYKNKDVAIYGPFSAPSYKESRNVGLKKVEEFLNVLRVIFDFIEDGHSGFKTQFGVNTSNYGQYASFDTNFYFPDTTWSRQFVIPEKLSETKYYSLLEYLWSMTDIKIEINEIEQRIIDSLHWFGIAKMSHDTKQQFISYFILLEGLLFAGSVGSKTSDLAERVTKIMFYDKDDEFSDKIKIYEEIRKLYKLRGDFVHEAEVFVDHDSVKKLNHITREVFIKYIKVSKDNLFKTKTDLRNWVLCQKI